MALLWCSRCKRNTEAAKVTDGSRSVTYQCTVCGKLTTVVKVQRSGKH